MSGYTNGIIKEHVERLPSITGAVLNVGRRRAADTAQGLSRKGAMAAAADRCCAAVERLIELAYEQDDTGYVNVDGITGVFERFPMPWGRYYGRYGLRATEAAVLAVHINKLQSVVKVAPLFTYDDVSRRWALNFFDYETRESAFSYWQRMRIDAKRYRLLLETVRKR